MGIRYYFLMKLTYGTVTLYRLAMYVYTLLHYEVKNQPYYRVAHQSDVNRMSSQNLAVIFAPCLIKRAQVVRAQEQLNDVTMQTM